MAVGYLRAENCCGYSAKQRITDEEIRMLIAEAESSGVIEPGSEP
jgi:hypothetical protein